MGSEAGGQSLAAAARGEPLQIDATSVTMLSLSIGIATALQGDDFAALARRADRALYAAKAAGRNAVWLAS